MDFKKELGHQNRSKFMQEVMTMDFKKELGHQNRTKFMQDVKRLLCIDVEFIDNEYLNQNPYLIYVKINRVGRNALLDYCKRRGFHIEYHYGNNAWITFDYDKMWKWYDAFNLDYNANIRLFHTEQNNAECLIANDV